MRNAKNKLKFKNEWLRRHTINIDGPYGSVVPVICTQSLAVMGEPDVDDMIF